MSDALMKYLLSPQAADRIEKLEAELRLMKTAGVIEVAIRNLNVYEYIAHCERRAKKAEAKLAKAVEALKDLADCVDDGCFCSEMHMAAVMDTARTTLAELKGQTDE